MQFDHRLFHMKQIRDIRLSSTSDAWAAWVYWAAVLERPDADRLVTGLNQARVALNRLYQRDIQSEQMIEWLKTWPTPLGLKQYRNTAGLQQSRHKTG